MYIRGDSHSGIEYILDQDEMKAMIQGKFKETICSDCGGKGWVWFDGETGDIREPAKGELSGENNMAKDACEECRGLGCYVHIYGE